METIETYLTHYKHFIKMLPTGEKNALLQEELYKRYVKALQAYDIQYNDPKYLISKDTFRRIVRKLSEDARVHGIRIVHSQKGIYLAANEDEWNKFVAQESHRAGSILQQLAGGSGKSLKRLINEVYFESKKESQFQEQLSFGDRL